MHEATLEGPPSSIEAYSCNLCVLDPMEDGPKITCMTGNDWQQAELADPVLGQVIARMQDGTLCQCPYKLTDPPALWQLI